MSEQQEQAPVVVSPPVPVIEKPRVSAQDLPEDALKARLQQELVKGQRSALESLGVANLDEAKLAIEAWRAAEAAKKTDAERAASAAAELARVTAENSSYRAALSLTRDAEAAKLTAEQRAAVDAVAGDDPTVWIRTLHALAPTWSLAAPAAAAPAPVAPVAPPATTSAAAPAPGGPGTPPVDPKTAYAHAKATNPFLASQMLLRNPGLLG